jgi:two-component system response regulator YesN
MGQSVRDAILEAASSPHGRTVQKIMQYVEEHFADSSLTLGKIAKELLFLNEDYVGKLFNKECGLSFSVYLTSVRMEQAKRIIETSDGPRIYEVARRVEFGYDAAYFGQVFRQYAGVTPGEYRRQRQ